MQFSMGALQRQRTYSFSQPHGLHNLIHLGDVKSEQIKALKMQHFQNTDVT